MLESSRVDPATLQLSRRDVFLLSLFLFVCVCVVVACLLAMLLILLCSGRIVKGAEGGKVTGGIGMHEVKFRINKKLKKNSLSDVLVLFCLRLLYFIAIP